MTRRLIPPAVLGGLDRWCAGQAILRGDVHRWITARERIDGRWQAIAVRHGGVAAGSWAVVSVGGWSAGVAGAAWAVAAWRRAPDHLPEAKPDDDHEEPNDAPADSSSDDRRAAYLTLIATLVGDRNGIHLGELYAHLRQFEHWADHDDTQLRALINDLGLPVRRTLRVGKIAGRSGIHGDDLMRVMTERGIPYPDPSPSPCGVEPGHSRVEPTVEPLERGVEPPVEARSTAVTVITSSRDHEPAWP